MVNFRDSTHWKNAWLVRTCRWLALVGLLAEQQVPAVVMDGDVDPANLGKGEWIYQLSAATGGLNGYVPSVTDVPSLMAYLRGTLQLQYIVVKAGDNGTPYPSSSSPQFTTNLVNAAHAQNLKIFGYTRCYGTSVSPILGLATNVFNCGADGFILDAEDEWVTNLGSGAASNAWWLCATIKTNWPTKFLAHSPICNISGHSSFPYKEFGYWCDAVMPQVYWVAWGKANRSWKDPLTGQYYYQVCTPAAAIGLMDAEWRAFQNSLTGNTPLGTSWTNVIKPLVPIGQADSPGATNWTGALNQTFADMTNFVWGLKTDSASVSAGGYKGCCFFAIGESGGYGQDTGMLAGIAASTIGDRGLEFYVEPTSKTALPGMTVSFEAVAGGPAPMRYRWFKSGSPLSDGAGVLGATTSLLTLSSVLAAQAGEYRVVVTNFSGSITSRVATLFVMDPYISVQPVSKTVAAATAVAFSVVASGSPIMSYEWRKNNLKMSNGGNVSGASAATLNIANVGAGDVASYCVVVQNPIGSVTSSVARLTVTGLPTPPSITTQPANRTAAVGSSPSFSVVAAGSTPLAYQWRWNGESLSGATGSSYTVTNATLASAGSYSVVVTNAFGTSTSIDAVLTVGYSLSVTVTGYGSVIKNPDLAVYLPGTVVNLSAVPGEGNTWLNWSGDISGTSDSVTVAMDCNKNIAAAFSSDVIIDNRNSGFSASTGWQTATDSAETHQYGSDYRYNLASSSMGALATFTPNLAVAGYYNVYIWYQEGADRTSCARWETFNEGGFEKSVRSYVNQQSNGGQWVQIAIQKAFPAGAIGYVRVVNQTADYAVLPRPKVIADAVKFAYSAVQSPPSISSQPQNATVNSGDAVTLTLGASGAQLSYKWFKNDALLSDGTNVFGSSAANLSLSNITLADCGSYYAVVSNVLGAVTSQVATITMGPSILAHPTSVTVVADGNATFSVTATGSPPLSYQWQQDGLPLSDGPRILGATNNTLNLSHVCLIDAGIYSVFVTNVAGSIVSSSAVLVVISRPQVGTPVLIGSQLRFRLAGESGASYGIETSTNLLDWISATNLIATNGACEFLDTTPDPQRFYRAVKQFSTGE